MMLFLILASVGGARAAENGIISGRILDGAGRAVAGGEIFAYDSPATRRPADFISPRSDEAGSYRLTLPAGTYWLVARLRGGEKFGPLPFGGRHSGEPRETEVAPGKEVIADFTVLDVREAARLQRPSEEGCREVSGRLVDREGEPVVGAYAFARREGTSGLVPDYLSVGADADGRYSIYLPPGRYCLGGAITFPPEEGTECRNVDVSAEQIVIANDLQLNYSIPASQKRSVNSKSLD